MAQQPQRRPAAPGNAPAASRAPADDELALQPVGDDEEEAARARRNRPHNMPPPITGGRPLDVGDTSRLLVYAGIFGVVVILATLYMLFKSDGPAKTVINEATARPAEKGAAPTAQAPAANATKPADAPKPGTAPNNTAAKPMPAVPATADASKPSAPVPANPANNAANKNTYYAYAKFMAWAYSQALELPGKALADRFKNEVSLKGVDDADVTELCNQSMEMFNVCGNNTLRNSGEQVQIDGAGGRASMQSSELSQKVRAANINMRVLSRKLEARYGKPEISDLPAPVANANANDAMGGSSPPPGVGAVDNKELRAPTTQAEKPVVAAKPKDDEMDIDKPKKDSKLPFDPKTPPKKKKLEELDE